MASKAKKDQGDNSQPETPDLFRIPDAKPILSKHTVDIDKPKVLIKDI